MPDSFEHAKMLEKAGFRREQSEATVRMVGKMIDQKFVTIPLFEKAMDEAHHEREAIRQEAKTERDAGFQEAKADRAAIRNEMSQGFQEARADREAIRHEMGQGFQEAKFERAVMKRDLTIRLGSIVLASSALMISAMGLMFKFF